MTVPAERAAARPAIDRPSTIFRYGRGANFVFLDWWADENELHHHVYISPGDEPTALRPARESDSIACVWDLAVMGFERQAWIDAVLNNPTGPDLKAYLARRMDSSV